MLGWGLTSLIVAICAAIVGFSGNDGSAVETARLIFEIAIGLFAVSTVVRVVRGNG